MQTIETTGLNRIHRVFNAGGKSVKQPGPRPAGGKTLNPTQPQKPWRFAPGACNTMEEHLYHGQEYGGTLRTFFC